MATGNTPDAVASGADFGPVLMGTGWVDRIDSVAHRLIDALHWSLLDAAEVPSRAPAAVALLTDQGRSGSATRVLGLFVLSVLAALAVAACVHGLLAPARSRLRGARPQQLPGFLLAKLQALAVDLAMPAAFFGATLVLNPLIFGGNGLALTASDSFRSFITGMDSSIAIGWAAVMVLQTLFEADRPGLRLLPLDDAAAAMARGRTLVMIVVALGLWVAGYGAFLLGFGRGLPQLLLVADGIAVSALWLAGLAKARRALTGFAEYWATLGMVVIVGLGVTWTVDVLLESNPPLYGVLGTLLTIIVVQSIEAALGPALAVLRRRLLSRLDRGEVIFAPSGASETLEAVQLPETLAPPALEAAIDRFLAVVHAAISWSLLVLVVLAQCRFWDVDLSTLLGSATGRTAFGRLTDAGLALLVGWYAWRLFETGLAVALGRDDARHGQTAAAGHGPASGSRANTLQPLLRSLGRTVIGAIALMDALSALGLNIAPLLASAGVVGIAVGFGAQSLVRDLFSGAFYLLEDVFRIGDYIEAGQAKGTVEKITFRTVALRHQNGPLHFVPYGALGSVRNNSRDWVIDKFELPLPVWVDSDKVRRIIKRIGQDLSADPVLGRVIVAPLKAKLYRIQPGAKIFRCKVQTPPGLQFEVRAEAYLRIEAALAAAGIPYADNATQVTVTVPAAPGTGSPPGPASPRQAIPTTAPA